MAASDIREMTLLRKSHVFMKFNTGFVFVTDTGNECGDSHAVRLAFKVLEHLLPESFAALVGAEKISEFCSGAKHGDWPEGMQHSKPDKTSIRI